MRAPSSSRVLAFGVLLGLTGCAGPFGARLGRPAPGSPAPRGAPPAPERGAASSGALESAEIAVARVEPRCIDLGSVADDGADSEHVTVDDGFEAPPSPEPAGASAAAPFSELTDAEIRARLRVDIGALGPMSIGGAHRGVLVAGVRMPEGGNWEVVSPGLAWGTRETVDALAHAIDAVAARFPGTPRAFIGDISARQGGHLPPHVSHQSGRDVDLGYYLAEGHRWYAAANASNLDRARTWHLIRTLIADSDVDVILVDLQIQRILKAFALDIGEDPAWLDEIFQAGGKSQRPLIFHAKGHATHLHVRFYSPMAQELGRRAYGVLVARRLVSPPTLFVTHTVKPKETLGDLARRYKVTTDAIKKANGLTKGTLRVNRSYKIPQPGGVAMPGRLVLPPRRLPPSPSAVAAANVEAPCRPTSLR